jgi:hypothetical protein
MRWDGIPQIILKADGILPNEQVSRVDAIAVASPQIKLVGHQIYSQINEHDFEGCLVVVLLKYCIKWTIVSFFTTFTEFETWFVHLLIFLSKLL